MSLLEILTAIGGMACIFLPGLLLSYLFFRGKEVAFVERIVLGFSLGIAVNTLVLFGINRLFSIELKLLTCVVTIAAIMLAVVVVLLITKRIHFKGIRGLVDIPRGNRLAQYFCLSIVLALAFFMVFIPHLDYGYPLHIDEWYHYGYSQALTQAQGLPFTEPFYGEMVVTDHTEIGFHFFLSEIKLLTGLSWNNIFLVLPGFIFALTTLAAFIIGQRAKFGLEAAFFVALIPTTVRMIGPAFLVPVALGLFALAAILFLLHCCEIDWRKAIVLSLLVAFLFLSHPPTALAALLLCLIYGLVALWESEQKGVKRWQKPLIIWASGLVPLSILIIRYAHLVIEEAVEILQPGALWPVIYDAFPKFGYIPLLLFVVGVALLVLASTKRVWGLIVSAGCFLAILFLFQVLNIGVPIIYDRSFLYFFLLAAIIAGYATKELRQWCSYLLGKFTKKASLASLLIISTLVIAAGLLNVQSHLDEPYYHLITDNQYDDCQWIRENLDSSYEKALVNARIAIAFSPLSGMYIYVSDAAMILWYPERLGEVNELLRGNGSDTSWYIERNIDILYTELPVNTPELKKLKERIYAVPKELRYEESP